MIVRMNAPAERWLSPRATWLAIFGAWTLLVLLSAAQLYVYEATTGKPMPLRDALGWAMLAWYSWALLCPLIVPFVRRFRLEPGRWKRRLPIHLAGCVVFPLLKFAVQVALEPLVNPTRASFAESYVHFLAKGFHLAVITYWGIVVVSHLAYFLRRAVQRELAANRLQVQLANARLEALKTQIHPHFMFNTLQAATTLMHEDVDAAEGMLVRLAELLRASLDEAGVQEVPLARELELAAAYLAIEEARFKDRLKVSVNVDADVRDARVPVLILQPLIENAVRHGIARSKRSDLIEICGRREGVDLRLEVRNANATLGPVSDRGLGLANTKARLAELYGARQRFELQTILGGGVVAVVTIPLQRALAVRA